MIVDDAYKKWQDALRKVSQITDKLGMPVDEHIAETVAILYLLGFMTTGSCEGHVGRDTEGPYVMLGSIKARGLESRLKLISDHDSQEYIRLRNEITRQNILEQSKLFDLLKRFYASRKPIFGGMLMLGKIGYSDFRLNCQGSELAYADNTQDRKRRLARNQSEMRDFTAWLKELYFNSSGIVDLASERIPTAGSTTLTCQPTKKHSGVITRLARILERNNEIHVSSVYDGCFYGANGGPYIIFESPGADEVRQLAVATRGSMTPARRNQLYKEAMKYNVADQKVLYRLLSGFYEKTKQDMEYERALIIQTVGFSNFRLRHQGTEILLVESARERKRKLEANCDEMEDFCEYLAGI